MEMKRFIQFINLCTNIATTYIGARRNGDLERRYQLAFVCCRCGDGAAWERGLQVIKAEKRVQIVQRSNLWIWCVINVARVQIKAAHPLQ